MLGIIIGDVAAIVTVGPKYLALKGALWLLKRDYVRRCKSWN